MSTLRFLMAGNVDDGKSTLTGRLLFDTGNITSDQLNAIQAGTDAAPDLARLTDGLKAEREQGITIDVAYKYFSAAKRKFIIADAPGHIQYTRNMITGASTAGLVIILIDARHGITEQTKRHSLLVSLLGIPQVAVVVNKIDLVDYSEDVFQTVVKEYASLAASLNFDTISYLPVSALNGDNVVNKSANMPWYNGKTLLEMLETVPADISRNNADAGSRMYVQYVIATATENGSHHRGYAGRIISGSYRKGDTVTVLPSGVASRIKKIYVNTKEVEEAVEGDNVVLVPEDERDMGRGDMIVSQGVLPSMEKETDALVFWMDQKPLKEGNTYIVQVNARTLRCRIEKLYYKLNINTFKKDFQAEEVMMNDVAKIKIRATSALLTDSFAQIPANGRFILIDETSYITAGACVVN